MEKKIMMILVGKRRESAKEVQTLLSEYGCYIKTRLGMHDASETVCSETGLILLELVSDNAKHDELFSKMKQLPCVDVKLESLKITNC